jgi:hypothetical protein
MEGKTSTYFLWFFSNLIGEEGFKDSRVQGFKGLFSIDFFTAFDILSIFYIAVFIVPHSPSSTQVPC